jgi:hypothetical protein
MSLADTLSSPEFNLNPLSQLNQSHKFEKKIQY